MIDDLKFLQLWDLYSPLLTPKQKEITDLYFNYDLSLGEIAEQKGVTRQSVSDCLQKCRKQLEGYEKKLGFLRSLNDLSREYSAYMTTVQRFIKAQAQKQSVPASALMELNAKLEKVHKDFGVETIDLGEDGEIVGHYVER